MKIKRIFVIGVLLVLFVLAAGTAFAAKGDTNGVIWAVIEGKSPRINYQNSSYYLEIHNSNSYKVKATDNYGNNYYLNAGETQHGIALENTVIQRVVEFQR